MGSEQDRLADGLVEAMTTCKVPEDVFADDVFLDLNVPSWRFQLQGVDAFQEWLTDEAVPSTVEGRRLVPGTNGFALELALRDPEHLYRQVFLAEARGGVISELTLYCTGPWDAETEARQKAEAPMIRPD